MPVYMGNDVTAFEDIINRCIYANTNYVKYAHAHDI